MFLITNIGKYNEPNTNSKKNFTMIEILNKITIVRIYQIIFDIIIRLGLNNDNPPFL
jgi:hypothetical protein